MLHQGKPREIIDAYIGNTSKEIEPEISIRKILADFVLLYPLVGDGMLPVVFAALESQRGTPNILPMLVVPSIGNPVG